jgi:hypothetical protein
MATTDEPAPGRQLWRLNVDGHLHTAVARSNPTTLSRHLARATFDTAKRWKRLRRRAQ